MKAQKKYLPLVYICSKYSGDISGNTEAAKRYSRFAVDQGTIPLAPHLLLPLYYEGRDKARAGTFHGHGFPRQGGRALGIRQHIIAGYES